MAVTIVGIRLSVSGDAQVKGALAGAEKSLAGVQSAAADASQSLRNLAGAFAGAVTVGAFIKAADSVTILNNQLKLATGSAAAAATAYASLFDIAQRSRVSFTELGGTFATISRAAESLKLSQSALLGVTEAIGNAMTISGGSAEGMKAALVQLGQGLASGTLRGEELNSILEQTPRLAKALADGLGVSIGALRKLGEEGKLSAEAVITALRSQQSALATEVAQSATTVGQALQQLQNAVTVAVGDFDKASGSTGALATGIQAVATTIGELRRAFSGLEESKTDFTAFGEGVGAVMRTMTLGFTTTLTGIRQLGVGAAGLAAAGVALASGNVAGAREAMRAAGEDIDLLGSKWMAQSDAIINSAGSVARATEVNAQAMARLARQGTAATESIKPLDFSKLVGGVDKAKKKVDEFAAALSKVTAKDVGLSADYEKTLAALYSGFVKDRIVVDAYAEAVESLIKQQPFYIAGVRDAAEAEKDRIKALDDATKSTAQYYEALQKELGALEANIEKLTLENEQIGLSKESVVQLTLARMDEAIATEEQTLAMLTLHEAAGEEIKLIERRIALMKQERSLTASNSTKQTTADAAKDAAKEWEKTTDKINDTLTDALMRGFEGGKGFAENLRDTVENMFKSLVLRPIVSAVVSPVSGAITAGLGLPGAASAATSGANAMSGMGMLGGSLGALGTGLGAGAGMIAGGGVGGWLTASTSLIGTGTAAGAMAGIGALAGPIGAALAVASLLKGLDDSGTMHTGGIGGYSAAGGTATGAAAGLRFGVDAKDYTASAATASAQIAQSIVGMLDSTATTFGQKAGYYAATAFADDTSKDGAWGALMIKMGDQVLLDWANNPERDANVPRVFADGEAGAKEYAAAVAKDVRDYLITQTPAWADTMLTALGDAPTLENLSAVVAQINAAATAMDGMGKASTAFAGMSEAAASALITAMGGAEAAVTNLSGYYSNFYTESERSGIATADLTTQLASLGKELPTSREAFRALVDAAVAAGDTTLAAGLINLQDEFAALVPAAEAAATAAEAAATAVAKANEQAVASQSADRKAELAARRAAEAQAAEAMAETLRVYQEGAESFNTLRQSLLLAGDAAGLLAATTERSFANPNGQYTAGGQQYSTPTWTEGTTAAQFNYAYGVMAARLRRDLSDDLSANALRVQNVGPALSELSVDHMLGQYDPVTGAAAQGIATALAEQVGSVAAAAFGPVALAVAQRQTGTAYGAAGPGLASVFAAQRQASFDGNDDRAYSFALAVLSETMRTGKLDAEQYATALDTLNSTLPEAAAAFGNVEVQAARAAAAAGAIGQAGLASIQFYFGQLGTMVEELAAAAAEAAEPIAQASAAIGRFNSASTAFSLSARAALQLQNADETGQALLGVNAGTISKAALIAEAAAIASGLVTTSDAAKVQEQTGLSRDAALLLDGVKAFDPQALENAFIRMSDALVKGAISEAEYSKLFNTSLDIFEDTKAKSEELAKTFNALRDAAKSLADELLLDKGLSTISGTQQLEEAQRQYRETLSLAFEGDAQAAQELGTVTKSMLTIAQNTFSSGADYARIFGSTVADVRRLEAVPAPVLPTFQAAQNSNGDMVFELRALREEVAALRSDQREGLAQVANGTNTTAKRLNEWTYNGLPATEVVA